MPVTSSSLHEQLALPAYLLSAALLQLLHMSNPTESTQLLPMYISFFQNEKTETQGNPEKCQVTQSVKEGAKIWTT